ncbi:MAG: molybdenum cofactor guanylyltransferase [Vicinamibacteria bacterium]
MDEYITVASAPKPGAGVEGAILAGGTSRRMGRDKLVLPFGSGTVLQAISEALLPLVERLRLIGRDSTPGLPFPASQPDIHPGLGPLSGIHAALATAEADRVLVVACDLPFVTTAFLRGLVEGLSPSLDAVVPCPGGQAVAVCALYRVTCLEGLAGRLERRELGASDFAKSLNARFLDDRDLTSLDPSGHCLLNLNPPLDYEKAREILRNESKT